jgi:AraC-like DNA-binding protein
MSRAAWFSCSCQARREIAAVDQGKAGIGLWRVTAAEVSRYIEQNRSEADPARGCLHAVSMSGNYLNTLFKSVTGRTIVQYAAEYKLEQAKLLLRQAYSIQEIAAMLGYYDLYHFSKTFKKATGQSPSRYRKAGDFTSAK